jgi:uncharacterized membrane protein YcaP (DUF421 family)
MSFEWNELFIVILRGLISLFTLFFITKLLGKKQVSQLSMFDYVIGISIGNFSAEITTNLESSLIYGIVAVIEFGLIAYSISILTMKSIKLRRFFMGVPTVLIDKGKIIEKAVKKVHFDVNDLLEECRSNGYFDLSEIEYALMESNGKLSIMPKSAYKPVTIKDLNLKQEVQGLCANVVIDGQLMKNNIENMHKTEEWILHELKIKGYKKLDIILLATLDINDKIIIYEKNEGANIYNVLE